MTLRDWDLPGPLNDLRREMDRLFDGFVGGVSRQMPFRGRLEPPVNLSEDGDGIYVDVEIPGVSMNDIDVQIADDGLTVRGTRAEPATEGVTLHRQERACGEFSRLVALPATVNSERVEAVLKDGVLRIKLPKSDVSNARRISIKSE